MYLNLLLRALCYFKMNFTREIGTYFEGYYSWDTLKIISVVWQSLVILIGPLLLYSIVWYERSSADLRYRTITNQLLSQLCLTDIFSFLIAQTLYLVTLLPFTFDMDGSKEMEGLKS